MMTNKNQLMRDAFLGSVYEEMQKDKNIYFLSADFGAQALDQMRENIPDRFFHMGICEQNMVDFAAGLSLAGKKVYLYAMAPFLIARAYEQIKAVVSAMQLPMVFIGVGVGLGYDHATLTHFTPEDTALARIIRGMNVYTPSDDLSAIEVAKKTFSSNETAYIRLERSIVDRVEAQAQGYSPYRIVYDGLKNKVVITTGYMTHSVLSAIQELPKQCRPTVIDLIKNFPIDQSLNILLKPVDDILFVSEQAKQGGLMSIFYEECDVLAHKNIHNISLDRQLVIENGERDHLHQVNKIAISDILQALRKM